MADWMAEKRKGEMWVDSSRQYGSALMKLVAWSALK